MDVMYVLMVSLGITDYGCYIHHGMSLFTIAYVLWRNTHR
jgi:hypothetical protein